MRSSNPSRNRRFRRHIQAPAAQAGWKEEVEQEIERLTSILRDPFAPSQAKVQAQAQIARYQEIAGLALPASADWIRQMHLLAE
jgi:hypothetical protein